MTWTAPGAIPATGASGTAANPIVASELIARLSVKPGSANLSDEDSFALSTISTSLLNAL
jgi:hypothetical protein